MTTVDFTNWLHSELDAVFNHDIQPGQVMLRAIPMIHELVSQNSGKPLVSGSLELLQLLLNKEQKAFDKSTEPDGWNKHDGRKRAIQSVMKQISEHEANDR